MAFLFPRLQKHICCNGSISASCLMLFRETVTVYYENRTEHTDAVHTSQETHYVSTTDTNRLMLFRETVAVHCENHTEHADAVHTSQETHYVSTIEPNRLMLIGETVAVYLRSIRNTQIQSLPHRKHITSPLQSPTG
jgi:hypothetical protein